MNAPRHPRPHGLLACLALAVLLVRPPGRPVGPRLGSRADHPSSVVATTLHAGRRHVRPARDQGCRLDHLAPPRRVHRHRDRRRGPGPQRPHAARPTLVPGARPAVGGGGGVVVRRSPHRRGPGRERLAGSGGCSPACRVERLGRACRGEPARGRGAEGAAAHSLGEVRRFAVVDRGAAPGLGAPLPRDRPFTGRWTKTRPTSKKISA